MDEKTIHDSFAQEINTHIQGRIERNGGNINIIDVIKEAKFCLAVNTMISQRILKEQGGEILFLDPLTMEYSFEGVRRALKDLLSDNFNDEHFEQIKLGYEKLMAEENVKDLINEHYNDLYQDYSSNVL